MGVSDNKNSLQYNLVVLGGGSVGKSALTLRFVTDKFMEDYDPTIEGNVCCFNCLSCSRCCLFSQRDVLTSFISFHPPLYFQHKTDCYRKQTVIDDEPALLDILDTAGQQEFNSMQDHWIQNGQGFLLCYDVTCRASFVEIEALFDKIYRTKQSDSVPIILVANKCDLEEQRVVKKEEGEALAKSRNCKVFDTSAKLKINNETIFFEAVRELRKQPVDPEKKGNYNTHHTLALHFCLIFSFLLLTLFLCLCVLLPSRYEKELVLDLISFQKRMQR